MSTSKCQILEVFRSRIGDDGRVVIPAPLRHRLGLLPGEVVMIEGEGDSVRVRNWDRVLEEVQAYFREAAPPGVSLSDELVADRRAEAGLEDDE